MKGIDIFVQTVRRWGERILPMESAYWRVRLPLREQVAALSVGLLATGIVAYVFYRSLLPFLLMAPAGWLAVPIWANVRSRKRRAQFLMQYQDMLYYLSVSLSAGKSMETAFLDTHLYLSAQYGKRETDLLRELALLGEKVSFREPVEVVLADLAERTELEDVRSFAEVVAIGRKVGGNLVEVIEQTVRVLREKMEIRREMETAWAAKKLEQRILCIAPVFLILMLQGGGSSFMAPMYETVAGRGMMTFALVLVAAGYAVGAHIMRDEP